jgi:hypothetical protein
MYVILTDWVIVPLGCTPAQILFLQISGTRSLHQYKCSHFLNQHQCFLNPSHRRLSPRISTPYIEKMAFTLAQQMVRSVGIFQGLLALPVMVFTAAFAMQALGYPYNYVYEFTSVFLIPV